MFYFEKVARLSLLHRSRSTDVKASTPHTEGIIWESLCYTFRLSCENKPVRGTEKVVGGWFKGRRY